MSWTDAGSPAPLAPALTVEDVFIECLANRVPPSTPVTAIVQAVKVWLDQQSVLRSMRADDFFAQPDTFGWAASPEFLAYWCPFVAAKFLKFAASEYAYFHPPPEQDTMGLTGKTAQLVKVEHLKATLQQQLQKLPATAAGAGPWRWGDDVDTVAILHAILFVLLFYERPAIAARAVEPVFLSIVAEQEEIFTVVPQLLSYFVPLMSFQGVSFPMRIALLGNQLSLHGFRFFVNVMMNVSANAAASVAEAPQGMEYVQMSVEETVLRVRELSSLAHGAADVRLRARIEHDSGEVHEAANITFNQYLSLVVYVCRQYYVRCKQATKKQQKSGETLLKLEPNHVMRVMKELRMMLRFGGPYADRFVHLGIWTDILRSEGWVPLQFVDEQLTLVTDSVLKTLPSKEKLDIVESLLRQHDNFQRFQVDICAVPNSPFNGQRCARSVYGHALINPPLYRYIICQRDCLVRASDSTALSSLPLYGWIALPEKPQKAFNAFPSLFPLFDNIPFFVVMPAEALGAFREYEETIPTPKKYDEKLRKPVLYFAEVYLRALARDGAALVLDSDDLVSLTSVSSSSKHAEQDSVCSSVPSSFRSSKLSSDISKGGAAAAPRNNGNTKGGTVGTEVYTQVQAESDSRTQRWYVFPQYHVKRPPKGTKAALEPAIHSTAAAADDAPGQDGDGAPPQPQQPVADAALHPDSQQYCMVRRHASRTGSVLGVPKLFFTGRVTELRGLKDTELSRHAVAHDSSESQDVGTPVEGDDGNDNDEDESDDAANVESGDAVQNARPRRSVGRSHVSRQVARLRGTPQEFEAIKLDSDEDELGGKNLAGDGSVARPAALCEYTIVASRAPTSLLPPVVVRLYSDADPSLAESPDGEPATTISIALSTQEVAAFYYLHSFSAARIEAIFADYVDDPFMTVETASSDNDAAAAAVAEWSRGSDAGGDHGALQQLRPRGRWGVPTSSLAAAPRLRANGTPILTNTTATAAASVPPSDNGLASFDVEPLKDLLVQFIDSRQVACVLSIRVATESGVSLNGCRQGIDKLKLFAKEKGLTYAKLGRLASRDRQGGGKGEAAPAASAEGDNRAAAAPPTAASSNAARTKVWDIEQFEFRKRVSWSIRDLEHILAEMRLMPGEISAATLTKALTRECEDRSANYELLEFIGDAVMDFVVAADACLLSNAVFRRQQESGLAGGDEGRNGDVVEGTAAAVTALVASTTPPTKWTPEASAVTLPRHCWIGSGHANWSAVMTDTTTAVLCRNCVIAELLPPTVASHFDEEHYPQLVAKVRADVFEALLGAAYRSGLGLDRLRGLLRRLFSFLPAAVRTAAAAKSPSTLQLLDALKACPYLLEDARLAVEKHTLFNTTQLFELAPKLLEAESTDGLGGREVGINTHLASSRLPRIQAKEYATMFTTGTAYAYRRLFYFDTVRVHNRILHLFSEQSIGFVNEIFTNTIHLVLDIDKVALSAWGLLGILWQWYESRYRCPAGVYALDCSGKTMDNGEPKWKDSCHVHFPQVTVSVDTWDRVVTDIRAAVVSALEEKEARLRDVFAAHVHAYRVWLRRKPLLDVLDSAGTHPQPHMWGYCDAAMLLQLSRTTRAVRRSVLEHVAYVTATLPGMAAFAELTSWEDIFVGDAKEEEELVVVEHRETRRRLILPLPWIAACAASPPRAVYKTSAEWTAIVDQGLTESKKLRLYLNDKCDIKYGVEKRPLVLDTLLLALPGASAGVDRDAKGAAVPPNNTAAMMTRAGGWPASTATLYRPQRFDRPRQETAVPFCVHRCQQDALRREAMHRIQRAQPATNASTTATIRVADAASLHHMPSGAPTDTAPVPIHPLQWDIYDDDTEHTASWVVECAHRSTLTLSSLRASEFRGTDMKVYSSWVDCVPEAAGSTADTKGTPLLAVEGEDDLLPSFRDVYEQRKPLLRQLEHTEWTTWLNFFKMRTPSFVMKDDKAVTVRVWSPAWWAFHPHTGVATFYIATEPVLCLPRMTSLSAALAPPPPPQAASGNGTWMGGSVGVGGGGGGFERVAQLFMPQILTANVAAIKVKDALSYLLFPDKASTPAAVNAAAATAAVGASSTPQPVAPYPLPATVNSIQPQPASPAVALHNTNDATATALTTNNVRSLMNPTASVAPLSASFGAAPRVTSLAAWVNTRPDAAAATAHSCAAWLRYAVSFIFTATDARAEFGSVPLILCGSEAVYAEVTEGLSPDKDVALQPPACILPSYDSSAVALFLRDTSASPHTARMALRHIFVVSPPCLDSNSKGEWVTTGAATNKPLVRTVCAFYELLLSKMPLGPSERPHLYVSTDELRDELRTALSPSAKVLLA